MPDLLAVDVALARILTQIDTLSTESVPTPQALGRILAGDVVADADIPPFANSSMDGYAVHAADLVHATPDHPVRLHVAADIPAGTVSEQPLQTGQVARIMTGAPLPPGADAVVPVEDTDDVWASTGNASVPDAVQIMRRVKAGDYVRPAGEDIHAGQTILSTGTRLRPQDIGVLVSIGRAEVSVFRQPRVVLISTGDELVDIDAPLTPGKIRNSNSYVLAGLVAQYGGIPIRLPVARDTLDAVRRCFHGALDQQPDLIVSSAGVSVGTHDVVRTVVDELGRIDLWRVNLRPGKPLAFGHVGGVPFFGLPGNPVSAMVTFDIFVRPVLLKLVGDDPDTMPMVTAVLGEDVRSDGRQSYLRVRLERRGDEFIAFLTGTQSSGALMSMVLADGLLIIPAGVTDAPAGSRYPVRLLRNPGWLP